MLKKICIMILSCLLVNGAYSQDNAVRIGIDGLTHGHVHGALQNISRKDAPIVITGIAEKNKELAQRLAKQYGFSMDIVYDTVEEMIEKTNPEGVMAFNSIYEHLSTVEACAPKGIHVMVEKPLAVNSLHAEKMAELARKNKILLLTNYETTWYPSNHKIYEEVNTKGDIGNIRKIMVCDGHEGPVEIGCDKEFLAWLTDPVLNGGGAVIDFGCYGANLATWLMKNELPLTVSATLKQIKPEIYPKVDDDAIIVLTYPKSQAIIQGSWNWPFSRKDMEVYGAKGYIKAPDADNLVTRLPGKKQVSEKIQPLPYPENEPFTYFAKTIKGDIQVDPLDLSSLENNLLVVRILDAAKESAKTGKTIHLK